MPTARPAKQRAVGHRLGGFEKMRDDKNELDALGALAVRGDWSGDNAEAAADAEGPLRLQIADATAWRDFWRDAVGREPPCDWPAGAAAAAYIAPIAATGGYAIAARCGADHVIHFTRVAPPNDAPRTMALTRPWRVILFTPLS